MGRTHYLYLRSTLWVVDAKYHSTMKKGELRCGKFCSEQA